MNLKPKYRAEILDLVTKYPDNFSRMISAKSRKYLLDFVKAETPLLEGYKLSTRCYWILHGLKDFPVCKVCGKPLKNEIKINVGYSPCCSHKCIQLYKPTREKIKRTKLEKYGDENYCNPIKARQTFMRKYNVSNPNFLPKVRAKIEATTLARYGVKMSLNSDVVREKRKDTWLRKYGVDNILKLDTIRDKGRKTMLKKYGVSNPSQSSDIQLKKASSYEYKGKFIHSSWELAFYIFLEDHNIKFEYQPNIYYTYTYKNQMHKYFPDFKVGNEIIEVKGNQFLNIDGSWKSPYKKGDNGLFEAKHKCILKNGVKILLEKDIKPYLDYVHQKYGKNYIKQFKRTKEEKQKYTNKNI